MENLEVDIEGESTEQMAERLHLLPIDLFLLSRALTHRSYLNEHPEAVEDHERLEFLGDAVLDFFVGAWLYNHFPEMPEGNLTRMRSALVQSEMLAKFARKLDLGKAMKLGRGEIQAGARNRSNLLCDTFEALVGAIYIQKGMDAIQDFLLPMISPIADEIQATGKLDDSKGFLQEWAQGNGYSTPEYITRSAMGPDHAKKYEVDVLINGQVFGSGEGPSKQLATKAAARSALSALGLT